MRKVDDRIRTNIQYLRNDMKKENCARQHCSHYITSVVSNIPWLLIVYMKEKFWQDERS